MVCTSVLGFSFDLIVAMRSRTEPLVTAASTGEAADDDVTGVAVEAVVVEGEGSTNDDLRELA